MSGQNHLNYRITPDKWRHMLSQSHKNHIHCNNVNNNDNTNSYFVHSWMNRCTEKLAQIQPLLELHPPPLPPTAPAPPSLPPSDPASPPAHLSMSMWLAGTVGRELNLKPHADTGNGWFWALLRECRNPLAGCQCTAAQVPPPPRSTTATEANNLSKTGQKACVELGSIIRLWEIICNMLDFGQDVFTWQYVFEKRGYSAEKCE